MTTSSPYRSTRTAAILLALCAIHPSMAATFSVTSNADSGAGSLREAITLRPDRHYAFALLAQAYSGDGQPAQAALAWQQASSLNPDNSFYIIQLGDALQASGDPEGAVEAYRRGLELNPESDYARRQLQALGVAP